jgi:6-phosphogluconolactonase
MQGTLKIFKDPEALADRVSDLLMGWIALSRGSRYHIALSGGTTPNLLFAALAEKHSTSGHWQKTHFWWVDDRMVHPSDPASNFGTAQNLLFSKIKIPVENIHRIRGEENPAHEALAYGQLMNKEVNSRNYLPKFDLLLLGLGEDGHTASIFPNQLELMKSKKICEVAFHPLNNQPRITLTGRTINNAAKVCFLVTGEGKAERLAEIHQAGRKAKKLPASYIHPDKGELYWFMDEAASRLIY